jgi:hypothetical protein
VRELGYGEDEDQVEEQLQGRDRLLAFVPGSQQITVSEDVHRLPPIFIAANYGRRSHYAAAAGPDRYESIRRPLQFSRGSHLRRGVLGRLYRQGAEDPNSLCVPQTHVCWPRMFPEFHAGSGVAKGALIGCSCLSQ